MSDHTSAYIFGSIFRLIDEHIADPVLRNTLAMKFWRLKEDANLDFADYSMESDKALKNLGLAREGVDPYYPDDGETTLYGPET